MSFLEVKNLGFQINDKIILDEVSFTASAGEFIGLIGPNGAGKTTLLKCINKINKGSGHVKVGGLFMESLSTRETAKKVSLMHQNISVAFPLPTIDVVMTARYSHLKRLQKESRKDFDIAEKYMNYTDTMQFADSAITDMSGGERQRVFFAKTLAQEADIMLLDEPTANLDIKYQNEIFKYAAEMCKSGKTIIAAVHDIKTAINYCSRLILMKDGRIIADGSPQEVVTEENLETAYAIKANVYMNEITGKLDFHVY